jgi:CRP/FNR family cyclic AMP-dependent transcriptional regulator
MRYAQLLSMVDIFADLNEEQIEKIDQVCTEKTFKQGETIFEENSPSKEFYIIVKGKVDIQISPDLILGGESTHEPVTIASLTRGQSFGEVALVDQGVRSASAIADSDLCKVLMIPRDDFINLLKQELEMGFIVMQNLATDLCFKLRNTNLQLRESYLS